MHRLRRRPVGSRPAWRSATAIGRDRQFQHETVVLVGPAWGLATAIRVPSGSPRRLRARTSSRAAHHAACGCGSRPEPPTTPPAGADRVPSGSPRRFQHELAVPSASPRLPRARGSSGAAHHAAVETNDLSGAARHLRRRRRETSGAARNAIRGRERRPEPLTTSLAARAVSGSARDARFGSRAPRRTAHPLARARGRRPERLGTRSEAFPRSDPRVKRAASCSSLLGLQARSRRTTLSRCAVWGNMSMPTASVTRKPASQSVRRSRPSVGGSHET